MNGYEALQKHFFNFIVTNTKLDKIEKLLINDALYNEKLYNY